MTDNQFDDELRALVEKYRQKDKTFDWTTAAQAKSYLRQPEPSQDVIQRAKQDLPVVTVPTDEENLQLRLERYKNAVAFGLYSEWPTCNQQEGMERAKLALWSQAAERIKQETLKRVLPE